MKISDHFSRGEFECSCGCGFNTVDVELISVLEDLREHFNRPIRITSGCRCLEHNASVGGRPNSQHLKGRAADIIIDGYHPAAVYRYVDENYPDRFGLGKYNGFCHIDTRDHKARWNG